MLLRIVAVAALLFAPQQASAPAKPAPAAETLPDAREIVNKHIKAVGGREGGVDVVDRVVQAAEPGEPVECLIAVAGLGEDAGGQ